MKRTDDNTNNDKGFSVVDRRAASDSDTDTSSADSNHDRPTYVKQLERALEERDRKLREFASSHETSMGDLESTRARMRREINREAESSRRSMLVDFLDVLDNLDRAIEAAGKTPDVGDVLTGVSMVRDLFVTKLEGLGVARVEAMGHRFDPSVHEALTMVPVDDPAVEGTVVGVIKEGYVIGQEVLRPATVAVAKSPMTT